MSYFKTNMDVSGLKELHGTNISEHVSNIVERLNPVKESILEYIESDSDNLNIFDAFDNVCILSNGLLDSVSIV